MKRPHIISMLFLIALLSACNQTRYITEKYIKTNIEKHKEGDFSAIQTYSIFKGISADHSSYLELTGYKYASTKALVIGADKYYSARQNFKGDQAKIAEITYIELNVDQCKSILENYKKIQTEIMKQKAKPNEQIYRDFTVTSDLFISFVITARSSSVTLLDLWIRGEKYRVSTKKIMKKLQKFIDY
ncbi:MAG: hypothetical protein KKD31_19480 [Bacteroidetes bacterium]|nr:hypothetical protein [Bacteroidota bacterium]